MGGISPEHPVSLVSGCGILANLDPHFFLAYPVLISLENAWVWPKNRQIPVGFDSEMAGEILLNPPSDWERIRFPHFSAFPKADVFFLGLHGVGGEDGRLQGFLDLAGQVYTGSRTLGSALAMDKILSKQIYSHNGIPTSPWMVLGPDEFGEEGARRVAKEIGLPAVVKHPTGGSSLGVVLAKTHGEIVQALIQIGKDTPRVLVEAYVQGTEASCGILEGAPVLFPTEIRSPNDAFFSFEAKYQKGRAQEITPAPFPPEIIQKIQALALRCHEVLNLSVYSRTDFIWNANKMVVLETNSLPGFTPNSLLPQQAAYAGMSYRNLLTHILSESVRLWRPL